ncbi:MAG: hypothetical protein AB1758_30895 [Candidatus Eremiobacterota bacterium]
MRLGFLAAGLTNILGILIFSKAFTNDHLTRAFPELFSAWGCGVVILWGLAYMAAGEDDMYWLAGVFAVEKAYYVVSWLWWLSVRGRDQLPALWQDDLLTGLFLSSYGVVDLAFGLYFLSVLLKAHRQGS